MHSNTDSYIAVDIGFGSYIAESGSCSSCGAFAATVVDFAFDATVDAVVVVVLVVVVAVAVTVGSVAVAVFGHHLIDDIVVAFECLNSGSKNSFAGTDS